MLFKNRRIFQCTSESCAFSIPTTVGTGTFIYEVFLVRHLTSPVDIAGDDAVEAHS